MPYDIAHNKMTVFGDCYDSAETWQWSIRYLPNRPANDANLLADATVFLAEMQQFYTAGTGNTFCASHRLIGVKCARINVDGKYPEDQDAQIAELPDPIAGGNAANAIPQLAVVITTETGNRRGLAHRGRFYLAGMQVAVTADGLASSAQIQPYLNGLTTALNEAKAAAEAGIGAWIVASNTRAGAHQTITGLSADTAIDTHQSRRRQLVGERLEAIGGVN